MHSYKSSGTSIGLMKAFTGGSYWLEASQDSGRIHNGAEISFKVATTPFNRGVELRRGLDQLYPQQKTVVYVDGAEAETWYRPDQNEFMRWIDSDFDVHRSLKEGKPSLDISLAIASDSRPFPTFTTRR